MLPPGFFPLQVVQMMGRGGGSVWGLLHFPTSTDHKIQDGTLRLASCQCPPTHPISTLCDNWMVSERKDTGKSCMHYIQHHIINKPHKQTTPQTNLINTLLLPFIACFSGQSPTAYTGFFRLWHCVPYSLAKSRGSLCSLLGQGCIRFG